MSEMTKQEPVSKPETEVEVVSLTLAPELERKLAEATVRIGRFTIKQISVWRTGSGTINVHMPSVQWRRFDGRLKPCGFYDLVELPEDVKKQVETAVKAAFKTRKEETKKDVQHSGTLE